MKASSSVWLSVGFLLFTISEEVKGSLEENVFQKENSCINFLGT